MYEYFVNRPNSIVLIGNHERKHQNKILSYAQEIVKVQHAYITIKKQIDKYTQELLNTHKESFNHEANKQSFKTFIFKSRSNNLTIEDLQKSLNTPNKVLKIKKELGI